VKENYKIEIDSLPLCIVIYEIDQDGDFVFKNINKKTQELEKIDKEELLGEKVHEAFPGIEAMGLLDVFRSVYETGEEQVHEIGLYEDSFRHGWRRNIVSKLSANSILVTYEDIGVDNELIAGFDEILEQKTERLKIEKKEFEEQVMNLEERVHTEVTKNESQQKQIFAQSRLAQMGEMISMIAHQWRQPLSAISATSANLKFKLEFNTLDFNIESEVEKSKNYILTKLENIESFVQTLTNTIDDFRNFYKPNKKSEILNVKEPIQKAFAIIETSLLSDGIQIIKEDHSNRKVELYENEMMQVILNILKNSQDNFKEKKKKSPKIYVSCEDIERKTIVTICDNGGGIPKEIIEKVFDPYFSTKSEKNGTGLGLYMSKIIIEEHHNGMLTVRNHESGTCFQIEIGREN